MKTKSKASGRDLEIGKRIRLLREAAGLSQKKLGEHIGLTFQQIQKYEQGVNKAPVWAIEEIAKVLHVSPSELIGWNLSPSEPRSKLEAKLLSKFRDLDDQQQVCFISALNALSKAMV